MQMEESMLTPSQAYCIASQWGSYQSDTDPGRVFYTFRTCDARPMNEHHREWCIEYTERCITIASNRAIQQGVNPSDDQDVLDLVKLRRFFNRTELRVRVAA